MATSHLHASNSRHRLFQVDHAAFSLANAIWVKSPHDAEIYAYLSSR